MAPQAEAFTKLLNNNYKVSPTPCFTLTRKYYI